MRRIPASILCLMLPVASFSFARVDHVEVLSRSEVLDGRSFGLAGPYEEIVARVHFCVRPENPHNQQIVDLDKADRNAQGEVDFSSDLYLLKPKHAFQGNGTLLMEIPNRGGRGLLRIVNGGTSTDTKQEAAFGDGFLLRQGYTLAWLGWEYDLGPQPRNVRLYAPVAHEPGGKEIHGLVRSDFTLSQARSDMPLGHFLLGADGGRSYPVDVVASTANVLTVREAPTGKRELIPRSQWSFAHEVAGILTPDPHFIHLSSGFVPGQIYEVVYSAKNPVVVGLGLAAVRDFVSYLKHDVHAIAPVERAYAAGISQSGRFLRHFIYQDFNIDEQERQVLDGMIVHVAGAGRGSFNHRFAQPSRDAQPMSSIFFPTDLFPFTDLPEKDPESLESAGLLDAARASHSAPKVFYTNTSYEYWGRAASLIHTSADGTMDAEIPDNVRIYFLAGLQHFSATFPPARRTPGNPDSTAQQRHNPNPIRWFWRAFITDMDQWVKDGRLPPASVYPKIADGTLTRISELAFPAISGLHIPKDTNQAYHLNFGPQWKQGVVSLEPPVIGKPFSVLLPKPDLDGNDLGGVRPPELAVPLATYTGWNLRDPNIGAPDRRLSFLGSYIPFAKAAEMRKQNGDPRRSIAERYSSREQYLGMYAESALQLIRQRFMLAEDLSAVLERGGEEWQEAMK